jgi:hypothetical protein
MTDPLLILIEALEQQQPHAPITRGQVAEALCIIAEELQRQRCRFMRLEVGSPPTAPKPEEAEDLQEVLPHLT